VAQAPQVCQIALDESAPVVGKPVRPVSLGEPIGSREAAGGDAPPIVVRNESNADT